MAHCGGCGQSFSDHMHVCPSCGGTAIPAHVERALQPVYRAGTVINERFRVEEVLGTGASGVVYGVADLLLSRRAALKILWDKASENDSAYQRLRREIRAAQVVQNPHLVAVHDLIFVEEHPALLMEWVEGGTLRAKIRQQEAFGPEEAVTAGLDILSALEHLHGLAIVHRDVKSGNVLVGTDGAIKLGDFGLAKGEGLGASLTETGTALGTPGYMAPEVIRGKEATPLSDLYAVGVILFECLTGRLPFEGGSVPEVSAKQLTEDPPLEILKEKSVPRWLRAVIARLLEKNPADRFPSAKTTIQALKKHSPGFSLTRRAKVRAVAAAALFAAATGTGAFLWHRAREAPLSLAYHEKTLEARDTSGHLLWSKTLPEPVQTAIYGRFGSDGAPVAACVTTSRPEPGDFHQQRLWTVLHAFDRSGRPLGRTSLDLAFSPFSPRITATLESHRFARGQSERLVVGLWHMTWYPSGLKVFPPYGLRTQQQTTGALELNFENTGYLSRWLYADLDGDGVDEVVLSGVNNKLYGTTFAAALKLDQEPIQENPTAVSPNLSWRPASGLLFYRCLTFRRMTTFALKPGGSGHAALLQFPGQPALALLPDGEVALDGQRLRPSRSDVDRINAGLSRLCTLRDQGQFEVLLTENEALLGRAPEPYGWMGRFFAADALFGLGRYAEAARRMEEALGAAGEEEGPAYAYQVLADARFLGGDYRGCLTSLSNAPLEIRFARSELGHTAFWASIYAGDSQVLNHVLRDGGYRVYSWRPDLFAACLSFFAGDFLQAERRLKDMDYVKLKIPEPGLWLADTLLREGKTAEARAQFDRLVSDFPDDRLDEGEVALALRWQAGERTPALLARMDALTQKARMEAKTSVETRALLPLTLARAAGMHRNLGDAKNADALRAEAIRLAPKAWKGILGQ